MSLIVKRVENLEDYCKGKKETKYVKKEVRNENNQNHPSKAIWKEERVKQRKLKWTKPKLRNQLRQTFVLKCQSAIPHASYGKENT